MSNVNNQTAQHSNGKVTEGQVRAYPPSATQLSPDKNGFMMTLRLLLYQREVLKGVYKMSVIYQLSSLQYELIRRQALLVSLTSLLNNGLYQTFSFKPKALRQSFDGLAKMGILRREVKSVKGGYVGVLHYGLAPAGRALLREYYEYIGGAHDDKLDGLR